MKENKILISILVPTYNRVKYLEECLDSIIEQKGFDLKELELIVSDNSEGDETKVFMNRYIKKHKNWNIKYNKNEKNLGMVGNWNKLLELKKGEYFIFLSDDDKFYDKYSLNELYGGIKSNKASLCYGKRSFIDCDSNIIKEIDDASWAFINNNVEKYKKITLDFDLKYNFLGFGGILFKKCDIKFDYNVGLASDRCFNLKNLKTVGDGIFVNKLCFLYRFHLNQLNNSINIFEAIKQEFCVLSNLGLPHLQKIFLCIRYLLASIYGKMFGKLGRKVSFFIKKFLRKG